MEKKQPEAESGARQVAPKLTPQCKVSLRWAQNRGQNTDPTFAQAAVQGPTETEAKVVAADPNPGGADEHAAAMLEAGALSKKALGGPSHG